MDDPNISSIYRKENNKRKSFYSNFIKLSLFTISFLLYIFVFSPKIENIFKVYLLNSVRENSNITLNYLSPLFDQEIYKGSYDINTLVNADMLKEVDSNTRIETEDTRVIAMQKFLFDYNSPMYPSAKAFITEADKYGLDWRLVASISGVESAFGNLIPRGTHNAWGWRGINKNPDGWSLFSSWDAGIAEVTRGLAQGYGIHLTPFQIEPYYCPPCGLNPAHAWANGVTRYMRELKYYNDNLN
jgi:hypothetical protein